MQYVILGKTYGTPEQKPKTSTEDTETPISSDYCLESDAEPSVCSGAG